MIRIALCGLGSAGRARLRALDGLEGFKLAGVVSRRNEFSTLDLNAALDNARHRRHRRFHGKPSLLLRKTHGKGPQDA